MRNRFNAYLINKCNYWACHQTVFKYLCIVHYLIICTDLQNINVGCLPRWKICNGLNFSSSFSKNLTTSNWMKKRMNEKVYSKLPHCPSFMSIYLIKVLEAYFIISRTTISLEFQCFNCQLWTGEQNRSNIFIIGSSQFQTKRARHQNDSPHLTRQPV